MSWFEGFNIGYCTWFYDKVAGIDIGVYCYDHDAAYLAGGFIRKLKSDLKLFTDVWKSGDRASSPEKNMVIKITAASMYAAVSVPGILFWLKTQIFVRQ